MPAYRYATKTGECAASSCCRRNVAKCSLCASAKGASPCAAPEAPTPDASTFIYPAAALVHKDRADPARAESALQPYSEIRIT